MAISIQVLMARRPKPWYRKSRKTWYVTVTIDGSRHKIGSTKTEADQKFKLLMKPPQEETSRDSEAAGRD
jgi:hypothetical protein